MHNNSFIATVNIHSCWKNRRLVVTEFLKLSDEFDTGQEILRNINHQILILCLGTANITSTERWWNCSFWILFRWIFCSTVVFGAFWTLYRNGNSVRWTVPLCKSFWTHAYFHISINVMIDILTFLVVTCSWHQKRKHEFSNSPTHEIKVLQNVFKMKKQGLECFLKW